MSISWQKRKARLCALLQSQGDECQDSLALDRILHGQTIIGKTSKTAEIDALRFKEQDFDILGALDHGQFGVIDLVRCHLDGRAYVKKSTEKVFALRNRNQCSPQTERDILLRATVTSAEWAPHLLCAFQSTTHVHLIMEYAEGGTLWDVLESSPHNGRVTESDLKWWAPQMVSAISWCHAQNFVHRDIKPHNFVLTSTSHVLLIDFGSAAPLLPKKHDGSQKLLRRHCLVPCGTCDYISPEILQAHEEALMAQEMSDEELSPDDQVVEGYGRETDWWSLGSTLYELAYGVAPFFANGIRQTYLKIINHQSSLHLNQSIALSGAYLDLIRRLLTSDEKRLGRRDVSELMTHPFFGDVDWANLRSQRTPADLHLPQFTYAPPVETSGQQQDAAAMNTNTPSKPFSFSPFFRSSKDSLSPPNVSFNHSTPSRSSSSRTSRTSASAFIGFSWGPLLNAFPSSEGTGSQWHSPHALWIPSTHTTPEPKLAVQPPDLRFVTPMRLNGQSPFPVHPQTGTPRRTLPRRGVSDREAMQQLADCVGRSARKKVLDSGRKPRMLRSFSHSESISWQKELRFDTLPVDEGVVIKDANGEIIDLPSDTESEGPPSPSPSPRPTSVMSFASKRSWTPTYWTSSSRVSDGEPLAGTSAPPGVNDVRPEAPSTSSENRSLESDLERKHKLLVEEIEDIERRLGSFMVNIRGEG